MSPPCLELETWLRMANLPYKKLIVTAQSFELDPKGKIPFIEYQGKPIGDVFLTLFCHFGREYSGMVRRSLIVVNNQNSGGDAPYFN
ncbi:hypothetical protein QUA81_21650 [Microcoleus sp. F6_B4]